MTRIDAGRARIPICEVLAAVQLLGVLLSRPRLPTYVLVPSHRALFPVVALFRAFNKAVGCTYAVDSMPPQQSCVVCCTVFAFQ
eukprot:CAMPEP_0181340934 /NCGR_PEP_ID=MMETSP1101-20121128/30122_1 /TAXON_ID=46948 /ORGANISM="Rhodomonas abbreviata, Strain Caron Lab Isolate" /LENGTH=83 /DNA_ID=CAMNT_0023452139 /DNA_START=45 /DNA_END=293 /DNA_ORIENTATION=-